MKKIKTLILLCCLLPLFSNAQSIEQKADELLTAYTQQKMFSGTVLIAKEDKILLEKGYGFANLEKQIPNTPDTKFNIGSVTKTFTSTIILQLVQKNKISLTDPLCKFISDYPEGQKILVKHLLSHTSGIKSYTSLEDYRTWVNQDLTTTQIIAKFKNHPLAFVPGEKMQYSNSNYILLSAIAEKVSGKKLEVLLSDNILKKANMAQSGANNNFKNIQNYATGYQSDPTNPTNWMPTTPISIISNAGAGFMYSTVKDLYLYDRSLRGNDLLSANTKQLAYTPFHNNYALGWMLSNDFGHQQIGHTGRTPDGYIANLMRYPSEDICIILLGNYAETNGQQLTNDLKAVVFNQPYQLPKQKQEVQLTAQELKKYVGKYQLDEKFSLQITSEDNKLYGLAPGDPNKTEFTAEGNNRFFIKGPNIEIEFQEESGEIKSLILKQGPGMKLIKLKS